MQQAGSLKKRHKRNIAKVTGLSNIQYHEAEDLFDEKSVFTSNTLKIQPVGRYSAAGIRMSAIFQESNRNNISSRSRVTRNPSFQEENEETFQEQEDFGYDAEKVLNFEPRGLSDRPYFLDKWTITRLRHIILLGMLSGTFPWIWNSKKHRINRWSPGWDKAWKIQWLFITIQTSLLSIFQVYALWHAIALEEHSTYRRLFMRSISLFWYFFGTVSNITMYFYKDQIRSYINTLFKFNFEFMKKYVVDLDGYADGGRIVINLSIPSNTCQVFVGVAAFLVMPFQPWYLFSYIYPKPWYWLIPGAIQDFVLVGQVITNYILYQWIIVAHTNSIEFWLREIETTIVAGQLMPLDNQKRLWKLIESCK
ncbi:unnamed protein product [Orchesella dallaii]|uniref:Transmembrane protein n=1 Tax=Orchesella dallaii TaxID=48710 RepID=A0ABP1RQ75_9HEXA